MCTSKGTKVYGKSVADERHGLNPLANDSFFFPFIEIAYASVSDSEF
jgi:hypothetical protein